MSPLARRVCVSLSALPATLGLLILAGLSGCGKTAVDPWPKDHPGPKVLVSFAPYYCFAANVAGDDAVVQSLMNTSGPHHFQPTDKDARLMHGADLFLVNGLGLDESMAENLKRGSNNEKLKIIELGEKIPADRLLAGSHHDRGEAGEDHHEHAQDPHVWLSPDEVITLVEGIKISLKAVDPAHAANYDRRAGEYIGKIKQLKADGLAMLKDKKDRRMITFHESLGYFARAFNLEIVGVVEKTPGVEPSDPQLKKIIALCVDDKHPVRLITAEPQYSLSGSGKALIQILREKKVPDPVLVEFDTLETVVPTDLSPGWYEARMRANLKALAENMR